LQRRVALTARGDKLLACLCQRLLDKGIAVRDRRFELMLVFDQAVMGVFGVAQELSLCVGCGQEVETAADLRPPAWRACPRLPWRAWRGRRNAPDHFAAL